MANPLAVFRKHQKILLAVFGVALMLVFTVGSIVSQYMYHENNASQNEVVVATKTESLRESDIQNLQFARHNVRYFMYAINQAAADKEPLARGIGIPDTNAEADVVQTAILARQAEQAGIEITDEAILGFLTRYSQDKLRSGDFARILQNVSQGRMSQTQFFDAMRRELLAQQFIRMFQRGILTPTPELAWEYFQRLNRRISLEAVPFEVANYLARVEEPTEAQIQAMYDDGKNRFPRPDSPDPGFRQLPQVAVQYVKANLTTFLPAAKAQITDEQVKLYYETNREEFRSTPLPPATGLPGATPAETTPAETTPAETTPAETTPAETTPAETTPLDLQLPEDSTESAAPVENPSDEVVPPLEDQSSAERTSTWIVAAQESPAQETADTVDGDALPETPAADDEVKAETQPADPLGDLSTETQEPDPLSDLPEAAGNNAGPEAPEFRPLEDVADEIRVRLATPIARQAMDEALNQVRSQMKAYFSTFLNWDLSPERDSTPQPPVPDLRELAGKHDLTYGSIPLVNGYQLQQTDPVSGDPLYEISRAYDTNGTRFDNYIFSDDLRLFEVRSIRGEVLDTEYLFWKTDEEAERVPPLVDIRDQVVRAAKMQQARELARQEAQQVADQLNQSHQRPRDAFANDPNRPVVDADGVTWLTSLSVPYLPPQLTPIPGIQYPGDGFMRAAFSLQPGTAGVALDNPQDTVYVVAVTRVDSDENQLREQFLRSGVTLEIQQLAQLESQRRLENWYTGLERELAVDWRRQPRPETRNQ